MSTALLIAAAFAAAMLPSAFARATLVHTPSLEMLRAESDWIGIVEIASGRQLRFKGNFCGATYTGRIVEQAKGTVTFGPDPGYKVGGKYLLFLKLPSFGQERFTTQHISGLET